MTKKRTGFGDRKRLRDEAIVDFSKQFINRREFMFKMTAAGAGVAMATRIADSVAAPAPQPTFNRWAAQADATIRFVKGPHAPDDTAFWDDMKGFFEEANPGITLQPEFFNWATMDAELTAAYASDSPWDVVYLVDLVLAKFVGAGQVADITAQTTDASFKENRAGIAPFTWDVTRFDDATYGVGTLGAVFNIFYNVDILEAAGITEFPQSRQELQDAAIALTSDGVFGFEFRDSAPDFAWWDWFPYIHNDGADIMTADLTAQALDPAGAAGTQYLADMRTVHEVTPETGAYDWEGKAALFAAGRVAILHDESWRAPVWDSQELGFSFEVAMAPPGEDGSKQTAMGNFGYATISEQSPNKEAAWEFINWWSSADVINEYAARVGLQTVRVDSVPPYTSPALTKIQTDLVPAVQPPQIHANYSEMLQSIWPEVERAYRGEQTGEEAMANAGVAIEELIGE